MEHPQHDLGHKESSFLQKQPKCGQEERQGKAGSKSCDRLSWALSSPVRPNPLPRGSMNPSPAFKPRTLTVLPTQYHHTGDQTPDCSTPGLTASGVCSRFCLFFTFSIFFLVLGLVHDGQMLYPRTTSLVVGF